MFINGVWVQIIYGFHEHNYSKASWSYSIYIVKKEHQIIKKAVNVRNNTLYEDQYIKEMTLIFNTTLTVRT